MCRFQPISRLRIWGSGVRILSGAPFNPLIYNHKFYEFSVTLAQPRAGVSNMSAIGSELNRTAFPFCTVIVRLRNPLLTPPCKGPFLRNVMHISRCAPDLSPFFKLRRVVTAVTSCYSSMNLAAYRWRNSRHLPSEVVRPKRLRPISLGTTSRSRPDVSLGVVPSL